MEYLNIYKNMHKKAHMNVHMTPYLRGSVTVEMAYVLPSIILIFLLILYTVFYFHDKNILNGAAAETAVLGAQIVREPGREETDLQGFYKDRIRGKLITLRLTGVEVKNSEDKVTIIASAGRKWMRVSVEQTAVISRPEKEIRKKRRLESLTDKEG